MRIRFLALVTPVVLFSGCSGPSPTSAPSGTPTAGSAPTVMTTSTVTTTSAAASATPPATAHATSSTPRATASTPRVTSTTRASTDNGVRSLSGDQILAKAQAAVRGLRSYRMRGQFSQPGTVGAFDLSLVGKAIKGTATLNGLTVELIMLGAYIYIKASDDFWRGQLPAGQEEVIALLHGKYVKESSADPGAAALSTINALMFLDPAGPVTKGATGIKNGQPTIAISFPHVSESDSTIVTATVYVATTGQPLPVRSERTDGELANFDRFNSVAAITAPNPSEVFDLTALGG